VPLAIATGASSNSRHSIGTGVIGGTLSATLIAIFFIPVFYWMLETLSAKFFGGNEATGSPPKPVATGAAATQAPHAAREGD
jgi:multidrug efflux pump